MEYIPPKTYSLPTSQNSSFIKFQLFVGGSGKSQLKAKVEPLPGGAKSHPPVTCNLGESSASDHGSVSGRILLHSTPTENTKTKLDALAGHQSKNVQNHAVSVYRDVAFEVIFHNQ